MASSCGGLEPEQAHKDLHTVQLKPTIKAQISGRMASIGISDVVTTSLYSEKTRLNKLMKIIVIITSNRKNIY